MDTYRGLSPAPNPIIRKIRTVPISPLRMPVISPRIISNSALHAKIKTRIRYCLIWLFIYCFIAITGFFQVKVIDTFEAFENQYLKNLDEETTYVVNFWATWCSPCKRELNNIGFPIQHMQTQNQQKSGKK